MTTGSLKHVIGLITDGMAHTRYKALRRNIHVVDNTLRDESNSDQLFKIRLGKLPKD